MTKERATMLLLEAQQYINENIGYPETKQILDDNLMFIDNEPELMDDPMSIAHQLHDADGAMPMPECVAKFLLEIYFDAYSVGDADAACALGSLYYTGRAGEQNYKKAVEYYTFAEEHGSRQAGENLGYCYYYGRDVEKDYEKAYHYFVKGALDGHIISLYKIGDMYRNGYYVRKDENEAFAIYDHCAELLTDDSIPFCGADVYMRIAECFHRGIGVDIDLDRALFLYQRAEVWFYDRLRKGDFMIVRNLDRVIEAEEEARKQIRMSMPDKMFEL